MKTRLLATMLLSGMIATTVHTAYADPHGGPGDSIRGASSGNRGDFRNAPGPNGGGPNGRDRQRGWRRGDRYTGPRNDGRIIRDWRRRPGLWRPPQGYYWMHSGDQYLLTAIATGLITGVVGGVASQPGMPGEPPPPPPPPGPY